MTSNIQKALNQEKAFQSVNQENLMGLLLAAEQVRNALDQLMQSWGITRQQYNVLRILRGAGKAGLPCMQIADRMVENTPGLTRLIDRLEKKNLVSRKHGTEDRRQVLIFISKKGAALLKKMDPAVTEFDKSLFTDFNDKEMKELRKLLDKFLA